MEKFIYILLLSLFSSYTCASTQEEKKDYVFHERFPFIIITSDTVQYLPRFTDEEFYAASAGAVFRVNRTEIPDDDEFMKTYRTQVLPMVNDSRLQLRKVLIRGAASPEGPYENNRRLGRGRSQALLEALRRDLLFQYVDAKTETVSITEDYGYLCLLMKEAADPDYQAVQSIYDQCNGDELKCKTSLQKAQGGALWKRLLKEYFPKLRSARIVLWFSMPDSAHAPKGLDFSQDIVQMGKPDYNIPPIYAPIAPVMEETYGKRHVLALRTNLIHDFFYMPNFGFAPSPNVQLEYYPLSGHYTYNLGMTWGTRRLWEQQKFWQVRDFQFEVRRYFKGNGEFLGTYLGAFAHGSKYGIGFDKNRGWEGEGGGVGIALGHTVALSPNKAWRLEFMVAVGAYLTFFDPYVYGNPLSSNKDDKYYYNYLGSASDFRKRNHKLTWIGPTNIGIQITRDIIYRKIHGRSTKASSGKKMKKGGDK